MDNENNPKSILSDEIDLIILIRIFWKNKWSIIFITFIFGVFSIVYSKSLPDIYKSEVLVASISDKQDGISNSQLSGLASLAGIKVGGGAVDKSILAIETMKSREFLSQFINRHEILPLLLAVKKWDENKKPIFDENQFNENTKKWNEKVYANGPSIQKAYSKLSAMISFLPDNKSKMIRISIEHFSPDIAKQWVTWLVEDINSMMKSRDTEEAEKSISYLELQLSKTNIADVRSVLYQLIEEQTKTMMLVNVHNEYIFKTIDPAIAPEQKNKPNRSYICIVGLFLGFTISLIFSIIKHQISKDLSKL